MKSKKTVVKKVAKKTVKKPAKKVVKQPVKKVAKKPVKKNTLKKILNKVVKRVTDIVSTKKKGLNASIENGSVFMNPEVDQADPVDTSAKTVGQTAAKVKDGTVIVEVETEKQEADPLFISKVSITKTKDGMVIVEPLIDD